MLHVLLTSIPYLKLSAINACEPKTLFDAIKMARIRYYHTIAKKGENGKFLKGWLLRIEGIVFEEY
jgi:hypothetical protein